MLRGSQGISDDDLSRNVRADRLAAECPDPALPATECGAGWGEGDDAKYHAARNRPWGRGGEAIADCGAGLRVAPRSGDGLLFYNMGVRPHDLLLGLWVAFFQECQQ